MHARAPYVHRGTGGARLAMLPRVQPGRLRRMAVHAERGGPVRRRRRTLLSFRAVGSRNYSKTTRRVPGSS